MPKSKHGRGKHPHSSKKYKMKQRQALAGSQPSESQNTAMTAATSEAVATPVTTMPAAPKVSKAPRQGSSSAAVVTLDRSFILKELKQIGILTGIIVLVLIILAFVLR